MQTTLGPVLYFWPRQDVFDFYEKVSESSIDQVCLGEVTCSKRRELSYDDWMTICPKCWRMLAKRWFYRH